MAALTARGPFVRVLEQTVKSFRALSIGVFAMRWLRDFHVALACIFLTSCADLDKARLIDSAASRPRVSTIPVSNKTSKNCSDRAASVRSGSGPRSPRSDAQHSQAVEPQRPAVAVGADAELSVGGTPEGLKQVVHEVESLESTPPIEAPAPTIIDNGETQGDDIDAERGDESFTLDELLQMALANNPSIGQATAVVNKAQGIRTQVGLCPNPTLGYQGEEMGDDGTAGKQGAFISQTIVTGNKLRLNRDVANQNVQQLAWQLEAQRYRVRTDVQAQFYAALGAQRRLRLAHQLEDVAQGGVTTANELLDAGHAARPDVLQAEVQLGEIQIVRQNARHDYEAARLQLASLVGRPDLSSMSLVGTLEDATPEPDWQEAYDRLLTSSPELQAAYARVGRARAQISRQEAQPIPNLQTQFGALHDNATGDNLANVQLGIPLPIFNRNQGHINVAYSEYLRATRDVDRLRLSLRARLADEFRNYQNARQQVERYRDHILPRAKLNLDLTNKGYSQQEFDFLRVLTARRTYFEANLAYVGSLIELRRAEASISGFVLTGGLSDVPDIEDPGGLGSRDDALNGQ